MRYTYAWGDTFLGSLCMIHVVSPIKCFFTKISMTFYAPPAAAIKAMQDGYAFGDGKLISTKPSALSGSTTPVIEQFGIRSSIS